MITLIRGGGDLASGAAVRLFHSGLKVVITELPHPLAIRRLVSFAEAIPEGEWTIEGVTGKFISDCSQVEEVFTGDKIPVLIDPDLDCLPLLKPAVVIDARMRKKPPQEGVELAELVIGMGPGFIAGRNCHAVIETNRGHHLGRVYWSGAPEPDTGTPGEVQGYRAERVLRSPAVGIMENSCSIGDCVDEGDIVTSIGGNNLKAPFPGVVRGLLRNGTRVEAGMKIGDLDPRKNPAYSRQVSDKARALGGAVLEAILSREDLRSEL